MILCRKYLTVFSVAASERLVYRGDFFLSTLLRFIPIITTILLWRAVYDGAGRAQLGGLTYTSMVSYYLFVMITRSFGSMPGLAMGIAQDVREGNLRKFLLQPINYVAYLISLRAAHKAVFMATALVPFAVVFWLCRDYLPGWPDLPILGLYTLSLLLGFLLGFAINCLVGMLAFWFLEVGSLMYLFMISQYFLSGHMFPLSLLPEAIREVVALLPFAYETYHPTMIILQRVTCLEAVGILAWQAVWIVVLAAAIRLAWSRGLRRYAAFGG